MNAADLKPCPFCGARLTKMTHDLGTFYKHPNEACIIRNYEVEPIESDMLAWNTRKREWPENLTPELADVLGRPNFWCGPIAHILKKAGYDIAHSSEDEQAFILHWLAGLALEYGATWYEKAGEKLEAVEKSLKKEKRS